MSSPPAIDTEPWERIEAWTETAFDAPFVTVRARNAVYERPEFRESVAHLLPDHVDESMRAVFTTGLSFDPPIPGNETPESVLGVAATYASREFRRSLGEDGLLGVEQTGSKDLRLRGRPGAKAFQYDASYPLDAAVLGASEPPRLRVRVWAGLWPTADSFGMAGGIYPLEDLASAVGRTDADRHPDVEVKARPAGDRREVLDRIREAANGDRV